MPHAIVNPQNTVYLYASVTVTCAEGYVLNFSPFAQHHDFECLSTTYWSPNIDNVTCQAMGSNSLQLNYMRSLVRF